MLDKRYRGLYGNNMRKAGIFFAVVTGISNRIVSQKLYLLGNDLHLMAQEFLANGFHLPTTFPADQLFFRDFQQHFLFRKMIQHFCLTMFLLLLLMCRNENCIGGGFFSLMRDEYQAQQWEILIQES